MNITKEELTGYLKQGIVEVVFKKVDGTERTMPCTLKSDLIPVVESVVLDKPKKERKDNNNILRVYATDVQGWRSFRVDSILSVAYNVE